MYIHIYIYIYICTCIYEEFARLAETRLAQNTVNYTKIAQFAWRYLKYIELH